MLMFGHICAFFFHLFIKNCLIFWFLNYLHFNISYNLKMYICAEGCTHGELEKIYSLIEAHERNTGRKVDLLICCGKKNIRLFCYPKFLIFLLNFRRFPSCEKFRRFSMHGGSKKISQYGNILQVNQSYSHR